MGKDTEMSKEQLAQENERLAGEVSRLEAGLHEFQMSLQTVDNMYQQSKASFTLSRYGQLKDMIKQLASDQSLKKVQSLTENQAEAKPQAGGMAGLMQRARQFAAQDGASAQDQPPASAPPSKGGGKLSGLFKKIKHATGFSEGPPDVRCLDKDSIRRDSELKRREIRRLNARGQRAYQQLQHLQQRYQDSKKHAPPARYQELKDMIKDIIADQRA